MDGYIGEKDVSDRYDHTPGEAALLMLHMCGGVDGAHHKDWLLDQVTRLLNGAPFIVKEASWGNGHTELRYSVGTCDRYHAWVRNYCKGEDGPDTYDYDMGSPP